MPGAAAICMHLAQHSNRCQQLRPCTQPKPSNSPALPQFFFATSLYYIAVTMQQVLERIVDENAVPLGQGLLAKGAPSAAKTGARKALGNLTNTKPSASIATAGKQRRAFGEVRSIAKSENADCSAAAKPAATVAVAAVESKGEDLAARYAAEGVEQLAGKGWHQLERERYAREDAEISASVKQMAAGLATWSSMLPAFQVWGRRARLRAGWDGAALGGVRHVSVAAIQPRAHGCLGTANPVPLSPCALVSLLPCSRSARTRRMRHWSWRRWRLSRPAAPVSNQKRASGGHMAHLDA